MLKTKTCLKGFALIALAASSFVGCTKKEKITMSEAQTEIAPPAGQAEASAAQPAAEAQPPSEVAVAQATAAQVQPAVATEQESATSTHRILGSVTAGRIGSVSFKVAGHIQQMFFKSGDRVKKGQVLAALDDADYKLRARIAGVALQQAKVGLEQARRDLSREERLKRENASTQIQFERVSNGFESAQLAYAQAQLNHEQLTKADNDTKLRAPFDGVISKQFKFDGEYVGVGAPVYELYDVNQIEVTLKIPENLLSHVKVNQVFDVVVPSMGQKTKAKVGRVVPIINESSRTFDVVGKPEDAKLMPGQYIEAEL